MPWFGLGVWKSESGEETENAIKYALDAGYVHIDTASLYKNEESVGKAVNGYGIPRKEVFVTTKLWNSDQGYDSTFKALETSLDKMQMDYVDLYLIHWPKGELSVETWKAMEEINEKGLAKAIGVSNFMVNQLEEFLPHCKIVPAVNQVEYHPYLTLTDLREYCQKQGIQLEAWSPIMQGEVTKVPELIEIGEKYGKSPVQVTLRWDLQNSVVTIPKSVKQHRIADNGNIFDFELSEEDMAKINGLNRDHRFGPDPLNFDF
ncbi:9 [Durusdinium trenchii]|uniref:11-endoperoxide prostaglandin H2 reductase (Prostaglandin F2-alpha synthase) n=1 Tax=Durusdinium trenchii TaxID=1381693 RepID=A0ABP0MVN6_9DINO